MKTYIIILILMIPVITYADWNCQYIEWKHYENWNWYVSDTINYLTYNKNWSTLLYIVKENWKFSLVDNWIKWKQYDSISPPVFSSDWEKYFYIAKYNSKYFIVNNWIEWKQYNSISQAVYSPLWNEISFVSIKDGKHTIIKDGIEGKTYDNILFLRYIPNTTQLSYVAEDWTNFFTVNNWLEWKKIKWFSDVYYSNNWTPQWLIWKSDNSYIPVVNWEVVWSSTEKIFDLAISDDGLNYAYYTATKWNWYNIIVQHNWKPNFFKDIKSMDGFIVSWKSYWFIAKLNNEKYIAVVNWKISKEYNHIEQLILSNNGSSYSFYWKNETWYFVIKDNIEYGKYEWISKIWYSPNNELYIISEEKWKFQFILNWIKSKWYQIIHTPIFSREWNNFSYVVWNESKLFIIKDWIKIDKYENPIGPIYSWNWKSFSFIEKWYDKSFVVSYKCEWKNTLVNRKKELIISKVKLWKIENSNVYIKIFNNYVNTLNLAELKEVEQKIQNIFIKIEKLNISSKKIETEIIKLNYLLNLVLLKIESL